MLEVVPLRRRLNGTADLNPWADQWAFLASLHRLGREQIEGTVQTAERQGRVIGVRLPPQEDDEHEP